jgi:hypothetical protein
LDRCDFSYQRATKQSKARNEFKVMDFEDQLKKTGRPGSGSSEHRDSRWRDISIGKIDEFNL